MNPPEKITIVVVSDNLYAVLIAALIKSIEINHKTSELISLYIIDDGISKSNKRKLQNTVNPEITTLHWLKSNTIIPADIKIPFDQSSYPFTIYLRLFAPYAISQDCKKFIYMDVDMLLYDDISKLFHIDLGENILGATQDSQELVSYPYAIQNYKELGLAAETKYFNSGLMLINREKWIENNIAEKVMQCLHDNLKYIFYPDQYGLNVILHDKWQVISNLWNYSDFFKIPPNPFLVHFTNIKPIFKSYNNSEKHKDEFYRILNLTAFKDFKPKNDYHRKFKKGITKIKKFIYNKFNKAV